MRIIDNFTLMPQKPHFLKPQEGKPAFYVSVLPHFIGAVLDTELARAYYRMHQYMFTCNDVPFENGVVHSVFWLRYVVDKIKLTSSQRKIVERARSNFEVLPASSFTNTAEYEGLYHQYQETRDFNCAEWLDDTVGNQLMKFDSNIIEVRDKGKLIAAGIFDKGIESIAGIVNFYDPAYSKYSLGKAMIPLKYLYCREQGIKYYYPGYISLTYPKFSYKTTINADAIEVYLPAHDVWVGYGEFLASL